MLNPGALYGANPHSIAYVDLETMEASIIKLYSVSHERIVSAVIFFEAILAKLPLDSGIRSSQQSGFLLHLELIELWQHFAEPGIGGRMMRWQRWPNTLDTILRHRSRSNLSLVTPSQA